MLLVPNSAFTSLPDPLRATLSSLPDHITCNQQCIAIQLYHFQLAIGAPTLLFSATYAVCLYFKWYPTLWLPLPSTLHPMIFHLPVTPSPGLHPTFTLHPPLYLYESFPLPIHSLLPYCSSFPLCCGICTPQDQGPPCLLLSSKVILCYISLVGGLYSGINVWSGQPMLFIQWGCNLSLLLQSFSLAPHLAPWALSDGCS